MSRTIIVLLVVLVTFSTHTFADCPINEEFKCGSACQTTCSNLYKFCPIVNIKCNDACYCIEGYARIGGDTSPCIPKNECGNHH